MFSAYPVIWKTPISSEKCAINLKFRLHSHWMVEKRHQHRKYVSLLLRFRFFVTKASWFSVLLAAQCDKMTKSSFQRNILFALDVSPTLAQYTVKMSLSLQNALLYQVHFLRIEFTQFFFFLNIVKRIF